MPANLSAQDPAPTPAEKGAQAAGPLELDRKQIRIPCPPGTIPVRGRRCEDNSVINVRVPEGETAAGSEYEYTVSGGQILGSGPTVQWDLSGVVPGTYSITVLVRAPEKDPRSLQAAATIAECECVSDCACPALEVDGPEGTISANKNAVFKAYITGGSLEAVEYRWRVTNARIVGGQGTSSVTVAPNGRGEVTAAVDIYWGEGACESTCPQTASETVKLANDRVITGRVALIIDGDSIAVEDSRRKRWNVELAGIDAPELRQTYGPQAKAVLTQLLQGKNVRVEEKNADALGRIVGKVFLLPAAGRPNEFEANIWMVRSGNAWHDATFGAEQPPDERKGYTDAEAAARRERIGIWALKDPIRPADFRKGRPN